MIRKVGWGSFEWLTTMGEFLLCRGFGLDFGRRGLLAAGLSFYDLKRKSKKKNQMDKWSNLARLT